MFAYGPHDHGGLKPLYRLIQTRPAGFLLPVGPEVNINVLCVSGLKERESCLLVLNSVTSKPQWIRQPKPRDVVQDVCVFVCECA